ncbi:TonB-dependent receptor [SAR86 cluster bacterium]|nr:TonB-dependent receptor [SAR86 cluster bacterium]
MKKITFLVLMGLLNSFGLLIADEEVEEVVVTGSQIKGAKITGVLPVTILSSDDIDAIGPEDGTELMENIAEQGLNYFTEAESDSGGVNSARGDVGAYNLRNMGVGNTLVLLNGRRLVNNAGYQTELLGGDFVPTMSVNSNLIPSNALDRVELLKDGASAIYGADAVAGVVNNVLDTDYTGFEVSFRGNGYDHFDANDERVQIKYGADLNEGRTNISVMFDFYDRDSIAASEDPRWGDSDHRKWIPSDSLWANDGSFNNRYSGKWAQLDLRGRTDYSDSAGEIQIMPSTDPRCSRSDSIDTGYGTCLGVDTTSLANGEYYINPGQFRDYRGELERDNTFIFINHELQNGNEFFAELGQYNSDYRRLKEPAGDFSTALLNIGPDYYYTNLLGINSDNSSSNKNIRIDNWRPDIGPRIINVEKETSRFLVGLRGTTDSGWDWETALLSSKAESEDFTQNRLSNSLLEAGLADSTSNAINIFSSDVKTALAPAIIDVYRNDTSELNSFDFKASNPEIFNMPAGPVAMLVGYEYRKEEYSDDRDPRLDGTIRFTSTVTGLTFPFIGDVLGSSPTADTTGERETNSIFAEFIIPITENVESQIALRHEDPDDTDSSTVGKLALGWNVSENVSLRGSFSTSFRVPNLIQKNQLYVTRYGNVDDAVGEYIGGSNSFALDDRYQLQSFRIGNPDLKPEESDNYSLGIVWTPEIVDGLMLTYDSWEIEKENTIVLLGRSNQVVNDLINLINYGPNNCDAYNNPNVTRDNTFSYDAAELAAFANAGICPVGEALIVRDPYANAATRTISGEDIGLYYDLDTDLGSFKLSINYSETDEFTQEPTAEYAKLVAAQQSGQIPFNITLSGFGDLAGLDGNYVKKTSMKLNYRYGDWGAQISSLKKGDFYQNSETRSDGTKFVIPSMRTVNASVYYNFDIGDNEARIKLAVKNIDDERAPLADRFYGFFADAHQDYGRNYYLDFRLKM